MVFTSEDYDRLIARDGFIENLTSTLRFASVVFVGYSIRDAYLLDILSTNAKVARLLGDGPHFLFTSSVRADLPASIKPIRYVAHESTNHRAVQTALDIVAGAIGTKTSTAVSASDRHSMTESSVYFSDFYPPGTWTNSQTFELAETGGGETQFEGTVGTGFLNEELQSTLSTAHQDLIVALICFDKIYVPLRSIGLFYQNLGDVLFWSVIEDGCVKFVWDRQEIVATFRKSTPADGSLGLIGVRSPRDLAQEQTFDELLARLMPGAAGSPEDWSKTLARIRASSIDVESTTMNRALLNARGALILPQVRNAIGFSDAILPTRLPKWHRFTALRVAQVVKDAEICRQIYAASAKLPFGTAPLANVTYGLSVSEWNANQIASYVVAGHFNANLSAMASKEPGLMVTAWRFRNSNIASELRASVRIALRTNEGAEFISAVDGALRSFIRPELLDQAQAELRSLGTASNGVALYLPGAWTGDPFRAWRRRSAALLANVCKAQHIGVYDKCPCGSGDKFKFCCKPLLDEFAMYK